jgi:hypothetical protein
LPAVVCPESNTELLERVIVWSLSAHLLERREKVINIYSIKDKKQHPQVTMGWIR